MVIQKEAQIFNRKLSKPFIYHHHLPNCLHPRPIQLMKCDTVTCLISASEPDVSPACLENRTEPHLSTTCVTVSELTDRPSPDRKLCGTTATT